MRPRREVLTARLEIRPPTEEDRDRFVRLFMDPDFMIFWSGALSEDAAARRFDHMLSLCGEIPFGKQPIIERRSGVIVGYTGVDYFEFEGATRLEWGYRLVPECRERGYATEATRALLTRAAEYFAGELLAIIHPSNARSKNVCRKVGFTAWRQAEVDGEVRDLYRQVIGKFVP